MVLSIFWNVLPFFIKEEKEIFSKHPHALSLTGESLYSHARKPVEFQ